jgi:SAM-dependent methyltransferase
MRKPWFDLLNIHQPEISFPEGVDQNSLLAFLGSVCIEGGPASEMSGYLEREWRRFMYTWQLCRDIKGRCLEIGASPYFTTALLIEFTELDVVMSNYAPVPAKIGEHTVQWVSPQTGILAKHQMRHDLFNVECDRLPYPDDHFDVILFCEVLEHMTNDPMAALMEIRRVLKPRGQLILTTPNIVCANNVLKIVQGKNVNDRYSAYGPYGRHNREYTANEVAALLIQTGFAITTQFTANVLFRRTSQLIANFVAEIIFSIFSKPRARALGQYTFVSAVKESTGPAIRPDWLFRSYTDNEKTLGVHDKETAQTP